jgi:D-glycero-alpha-D-manno-heptose 1-phosphate guanylyltransferase
MQAGMQAVVLAGGLGTRLRSAVPDRPKPLALVAGRPFLHVLLESLERQGVRHVVLAIGYLGEMVRAAVGDRFGGIDVSYSVEEQPLGTGGGLKLALAHVRGPHAFVLNGDTYVDVDLPAMLSAHVASRASITVATVEVPDASRYGTVEVVGGRITAFVAAGRPGPGTINAGVYAMATDALAGEPEAAAFSFERDFLQARLDRLAPHSFPAGPAFIDIGTPTDYARAQTFFRA